MRLVVALVVLACVFAACGGDDKPNGTTNASTDLSATKAADAAHLYAATIAGSVPVSCSTQTYDRMLDKWRVTCANSQTLQQSQYLVADEPWDGTTFPGPDVTPCLARC
jgi:hypothetical protein